MPRALEWVISLAGVLLLSPLLLLMAMAVKVHDGGPVFYRARRIGKGGKEFALLKFRTMVLDADRRGGGLTTATDPRITPVGHILRKTKCDELPQLMNVLSGDMSFVGPRPEDPRYVALYSETQRTVLRVRPGITSAASLVYRNESALLAGPNPEHIYTTQILPDKLAIEMKYMQTRTVWTDLRLILLTLRAMFIDERVSDGAHH